MTEKPRWRWNAVLPGAAMMVFGAGSIAWVFPGAAASVAGSWVLPVLSVTGLALALGLATDWCWLRGFLVVLVTTLVVAWLRAHSATSTSHFAGASLGLLLMLIVGRVVHSPQRLRFAMLTFLGGGLFVLVVGLAGTHFPNWNSRESPLIDNLPRVHLGLAGLAPSGDVNSNALAAAALLIAPLGAAVLLLRTHEKVDWLGLQPLGLAVCVVGMLILALSQSRSAAMAVWLTIAASLVRGLRWGACRLLIGTAVVGLPLVAIASVHVQTQDEFVVKATRLWLTVQDRAQIMASGVELWRESPWFGIGLNQFRHVYQPLPATAGEDVAHAHNVFLQTALDVGVFGLAAYCGVLGFLLVRADQAARGPSRLCRSAAVGAALSLVAVSAFGLTDAVALGARVGLFQWMAGGLILAAYRVQRSPQDDRSGVGDEAVVRDSELDAILAVTRRLPVVPGMKVVAALLATWYVRKPRPAVESMMFGSKTRLNPHEAVERDLLFCPQLFDWREIAVFREHLAPGDVFLDLGSNIGGYSLALLRAVGKQGLIIAVDADPYSAAALQSTVSANEITQLRVFNFGLSDQEETLTFSPQIRGNRGGSSFLSDHDAKSIQVNCITLSQLLSMCGEVKSIKAAKLDLEGFEFRVLQRFFSEQPQPLWPQMLLVERSVSLMSKAGGDVNELIADKGYRLVLSHGENFIWSQILA